jgi:hypothetical protein
VEASTFGSEFIAAKTAVEMIEGLRYKLRMMGFPLAGPTSVLCNNQSVVTNASRPESTLSKMHNSIAYHRVREAQAAGTLCVGHVRSEHNYADMLIKCLDGVKLRGLRGQILK